MGIAVMPEAILLPKAATVKFHRDLLAFFEIELKFEARPETQAILEVIVEQTKRLLVAIESGDLDVLRPKRLDVTPSVH